MTLIFIAVFFLAVWSQVIPLYPSKGYILLADFRPVSQQNIYRYRFDFNAVGSSRCHLKVALTTWRRCCWNNNNNRAVWPQPFISFKRDWYGTSSCPLIGGNAKLGSRSVHNSLWMFVWALMDSRWSAESLTIVSSGKLLTVLEERSPVSKYLFFSAKQSLFQPSKHTQCFKFQSSIV